jgi:phage shock protein A
VAGLNAHAHRVWHARLAPRAPRQLLDKIGFWIAMAGLDAAYQRHLGTLRRVRRAVAGVATTRKQLELQISRLEQQARGQQDASRKATATSQRRLDQQAHTSARGAAEQLASLRRGYAEILAKEQRITAASRRLMTEIDAFRISQQAVKDAYTATEAAAQDARAQIL